MALFQPTNIYPSSLGELGNGTVDITKPLAVSWQVNGNSAMAAFSLTICKNDTDSTQVYTTGKLTEGCPFYGTDYAGNTVLFAYTIPADALSGAGMVNGQQYKLIIRQWWGETDAESVTQRSAAVFLTRTAPVLAVTAIPSPLTVRKHTFTATYTQAQGDALNWVRWMLRAADRKTVLHDSGRIYGTAELRMTYDGLFSGTDYEIRCQAQTENGVQADTGWVSFQVNYDTPSPTGAVEVCPSREKSGIRVTWPGLYDVPGRTEGAAEIQNGRMEIGDGGRVIWDQVAGKPMNYLHPWSLVWSGQVDVTFDNPILTIGLDGGSAVITLGKSGIIVTIDGKIVGQHDLTFGSELLQLLSSDEWKIVLAGDRIVIGRATTLFRGLYPSTTLYPRQTLYPDDSNGKFGLRMNYAPDWDIPLSGRFITSLTLGGVQSCDFLWVTGETLSQSMVETITDFNTDWKPGEFSGNTMFQTDFAGGSLQAGNMQFASTLTGFAIYRYHEGEDTLELVAQVPASQRSLWDCKALSQETYRYYIFGLMQTEDGKEPVAANALVSNAVTPIFWDWTVLRCTKDAGGAYHPAKIFRFSLNVSSGEIGNNNSPGILDNFSRYPTVQSSPSNYCSGTLSAAIGHVLASGEYKDTNAVRNAVYALSTTQDTLFLKNRRGNLWQIRAGGAISMSTMDGSCQQVQTVTLPWVEIGSVDEARILIAPDDALFS